MRPGGFGPLSNFLSECLFSPWKMHFPQKSNFSKVKIVIFAQSSRFFPSGKPNRFSVNLCPPELQQCIMGAVVLVYHAPILLYTPGSLAGLHLPECTMDSLPVHHGSYSYSALCPHALWLDYISHEAPQSPLTQCNASWEM